MNTDLLVRIVKAAGSYKQAVIDLMAAGLCYSAAARAAWAFYKDLPDGPTCPKTSPRQRE